MRYRETVFENETKKVWAIFILLITIRIYCTMVFIHTNVISIEGALSLRIVANWVLKMNYHKGHSKGRCNLLNL